MNFLCAAGFAVRVEGPYFFVLHAYTLDPGVRRLQFRSTDPGITRSDLSLLPPDSLLVGIPEE